jgi:2-polyprenyl-3-methyl-5-hydroxy-6-metoxy-1,4-benzoquinol methylase
MASSPMNNLAESSYASHEEHLRKMASTTESKFQHMLNKECAYYRLLAAPLKHLDAFLSLNHSWLTIGDYNGFEANYLIRQGQEVVASDISDAVLVEAKFLGLVHEISKQNVERLTYNDNAFDYVMCKEAFHHFPRAYLGLYEMIRVSKVATILVTEPIDILSKMSLMVCIKNILDTINPLLINKIWKNRFSFEEVGNYVFKISEREVEKIAMGMGLPCVAFKGYIMFKTHVPIEGLLDVPLNKKLYRKIQRRIALRSLISALGIIPYESLCSIIFKEQPSLQMVIDLKKQGFKIYQLPDNPYLAK